MIGSYIFIDTSVFRSESFFKASKRVSKLFRLAADGKLHILMPEITRSEWLKHYKEQAKLPCDDFLRKAELLGDTSRIDDVLKAIRAINPSTIIEESLSEHLAKSKVQIIGYDYCKDVAGVFEKYFAKEKPFGTDSKKDEFPDAFVLSSLEEYAKKKRIRKIYIFSSDGDMNGYESDILVPSNIADFLDGITKELAEVSEREKKDIETLTRCIKSGSISCIKEIKDRIVDFLSDTGLYNNSVQWQEVEDVSVDEDIALLFCEEGIQLTEITEEYIEATCQVEIKTTVEVEHMDVSDSYWDSEEQKYLFKNYTTTEIEVSTSVPITLQMDRTELDMGQDPKFELIDINLQPIVDAVEGEEY